MAVGWRSWVLNQIKQLSEQQSSPTVGLKQIYDYCLVEATKVFPSNNHPEAKIIQQLQQLRDRGDLKFNKKHGVYTLKDYLPKQWLNPQERNVIQSWQPTEREYYVEVFARDRRVRREAIEQFGDNCMIDRCQNAFKTEQGKNYIEVHHIKPLFEGGEDRIWNLAILCAHHHRLTHFAARPERQAIKLDLLDCVSSKLTG